jgi:hypothetical protein
VHFHAIIRLDHPDDGGNARGLRVTADELAAAIHQAAERIRVQGHADGGEVLELRLGEQIHTRVLADARDGETRRLARDGGASSTGFVCVGRQRWSCCRSRLIRRAELMY